MYRSEPILETPRLILRFMEPGDIDSLALLWTDPEVTRYMGGPRERAGLIRNLQEMAAFREKYDLWPVIEKQTRLVVGCAGVLEKEIEGQTEVELVYVLARSAWGMGYATEIAGAIKEYAFETLGLRRLLSLIDPENAASEHVAIKIGMRAVSEAVRPDGNMRRVYAVEAPGGSKV